MQILCLLKLKYTQIKENEFIRQLPIKSQLITLGNCWVKCCVFILGFPEVNFSKTSMQFSNWIHPSLHSSLCYNTEKKIILTVVHRDQPVAIGTICWHIHIHAYTCTCISARELKMCVIGLIRRLIGKANSKLQNKICKTEIHKY